MGRYNRELSARWNYGALSIFKGVLFSRKHYYAASNGITTLNTPPPPPPPPPPPKKSQQMRPETEDTGLSEVKSMLENVISKIEANKRAIQDLNTKVDSHCL